MPDPVSTAVKLTMKTSINFKCEEKQSQCEVTLVEETLFCNVSLQFEQDCSLGVCMRWCQTVTEDMSALFWLVMFIMREVKLKNSFEYFWICEVLYKETGNKW